MLGAQWTWARACASTARKASVACITCSCRGGVGLSFTPALCESIVRAMAMSLGHLSRARRPRVICLEGVVERQSLACIQPETWSLATRGYDFGTIMRARGTTAVQYGGTTTAEWADR